MLLIVEDDPKDLMTGESAALGAGFVALEATNSSQRAVEFLASRIKEGLALPKAILLDLDLAGESGYELLRYRYTSPELRKVPVLVWTSLASWNQDVCDLFRVNSYLDKSSSQSELRDALSKLRTAL